MMLRLVRGRSPLAILLFFSVAVLAGACNDDTTPTGNNGEDDDTVINVTVTADGSARQGVTVRLFAAGGSSALSSRTTASNGIAAFTDLEAGSYEAEIDVPSGLMLPEGETARRSVSVSEGGSAGVTFALVSEGGTGDFVDITLTGFIFDPSEVTISVGTTVRWTTDSNTLHTITPRNHNEWNRVEMSQTGQTFTHTFNNAGTFPYFCEPHESQGMTGTIIVE